MRQISRYYSLFGNLNNNLKSKHRNEHLNEYNKLQESLPLRNGLARHIRLVYSEVIGGNRPYLCQNCRGTFKKGSHLSAHEKRIV